MKKQTDRVPDTPFMNVKDAARVTGLSEYHLRQELAKGNVPHLMCGRCIKVNVPALLRQLDAVK